MVNVKHIFKNGLFLCDFHHAKRHSGHPINPGHPDHPDRILGVSSATRVKVGEVDFAAEGNFPVDHEKQSCLSGRERHRLLGSGDEAGRRSDVGNVRG